MTELAKRITIDRANQRVLIDGVEFPYYLAEGGPQVENPDGTDLPIVHLPILADDVEILPKDDPDGDCDACGHERGDHERGTEACTRLDAGACMCEKFTP